MSDEINEVLEQVAKHFEANSRTALEQEHDALEIGTLRAVKSAEFHQGRADAYAGIAAVVRTFKRPTRCPAKAQSVTVSVTEPEKEPLDVSPRHPKYPFGVIT